MTKHERQWFEDKRSKATRYRQLLNLSIIEDADALMSQFKKSKKLTLRETRRKK